MHDSGIGGMNHGGFRSLPPASDTTLMDRLLGNVNVKQQRILGRVVHLLREEFAFDGYMENGVEDLAIAEYIASLGVLKWDTFKNAVIEKYSDMYWNDELLSNLYAAVNDNRLVSGNRNIKGQERLSLGPKFMKQEEDSTSQHNEGARKMNHDGSQILSPVVTGYQHKKRSANQMKDTKQLDSSDTDTDSYKNYRVKTKLDSDKTKIYTKKVVPEDLIVADKEAPPSHVNSNSNSVSLPGQTDTQGLTTVNVLQQPSFSENITHSSNPHLLINTSYKKPPVPQTINLGLHSLHIQPHPYNNYFVSNGSASPRGIGLVSQLSRETSISSHSSSHSDLKEGENTSVDRKGHVVYHWAMIQLSMSPEMEYFMQDIDEQNSEKLLSKLSSLEQQIKMEKRVRRKTQNFYKSLVESARNINDTAKLDRSGKGEKNQLLQVAKDITDMTHRITFLDLCKTHIQMLLAELQGIDISYLHSIAICAPGEPLQLHPRPDNPLLQFQTFREPRTGCEIQALHAGTPEGLMAYLFASTALSDGFMHQFLYCFRYFTTAEDVLSFFINKYTSATKSGSTEINISRLQNRVLDFLQYWLEGFYSIDFNDKPVLINALRDFIREHVNEDSECGQILLGLLSNCCSGNNFELTSADPDESEMHFWQRDVPKLKWEFIKSLMRGKSSKKNKVSKVTISAVCVERRQRSLGIPEAGPLKYHSCRTDTFMLADYTSSCLAEQLCLIEQGLFQLTHPVHYLDSKCRGVGVALTMNAMRTPALTHRCSTEDGISLFLEPVKDNTAVQKMIEHAQGVSHWVAGEIVICSNSKTQQAVLSKFLHIAHACVQLRNFATGMAILDGLENLIIKQLPAWKNLPAKCSSIMDELHATKMFLKNDALLLMQQGNECHLYPTIPSVVFFLLHIQQLEIGGFKLANQMFKWGKIRSIAQVMDQIRIYREHIYGFEADHNLQDILRQRIHEMATKDIDIIAVQHDINVQKISSNSGISGAFKKMKEKFK